MVESPTRITRIGFADVTPAGAAANVATGATPPAHASNAAAARKRNFIFALFSIKRRRASRRGAPESDRIGLVDGLAVQLHVLQPESLHVVQVQRLRGVGRRAEVAIADDDVGHRQHRRRARPVVSLATGPSITTAW